MVGSTGHHCRLRTTQELLQSSPPPNLPTNCGQEVAPGTGAQGGIMIKANPAKLTRTLGTKQISEFWYGQKIHMTDEYVVSVEGGGQGVMAPWLEATLE